MYFNVRRVRAVESFVTIFYFIATLPNNVFYSLISLLISFRNILLYSLLLAFCRLDADSNWLPTLFYEENLLPRKSQARSVLTSNLKLQLQGVELT